MNEKQGRGPSPTERVPGRIPGEGGIPLEPMAGNAQLGLPSGARHLLRSQRKEKQPSPGQRGWPWGELFDANTEVPASGVYNVVDREGRYLDHQTTCHQGDGFPPATHEELLRKAGGDRYRYELAYEAVHLAAEDRPPPHPTTIYLPGEDVPISGVYNVVDREGNYLFHQRAWVKDHDEFGPTKDPAAHGYVLAYPAKHLSGD